MLNFFKKHIYGLNIALSSIALIVVYTAEFIFHYIPCELCLLNRIPYFFIMGLSILYLYTPLKYKNLIFYILILTFLIGIGLSLYQILVENGFIIHKCQISNTLEAQSFEEMVALKRAHDCSKPTWFIMGLSASIYDLMLKIFLLIINILKLKNLILKDK